jgi:arylsulfatase A-like enzyme
MKRTVRMAIATALTIMAVTPAVAQYRPNILVIFPDDVGWQNVSAYGLGTMGYTTPNIDRIADEGVMFTDHYAQPSCTAGRAALITGQYPIRSGMTTVGRPGAPLGLQQASPTIAEVLKAQGYATGQFGKNHLGDPIVTIGPCTQVRMARKVQLGPEQESRRHALSYSPVFGQFSG